MKTKHNAISKNFLPLSALTFLALFLLLLLPSTLAETMTYDQFTNMVYQNSYIHDKNITIVDNSSCLAYPNIDSGRKVTFYKVNLTLNSSQYISFEIMPNAKLTFDHCTLNNVAVSLFDNVEDDLSSYNHPTLIINNSHVSYSSSSYSCNGNTQYRNSQFISTEPILTDNGVRNENLSTWLNNHREGMTEKVIFENSDYSGNSFLRVHNDYYEDVAGNLCFGYACHTNEYTYQKLVNISKDILIKNSRINFKNSFLYDSLTSYILQNSEVLGNDKSFINIYGSSMNNTLSHVFYFYVSNSSKDKVFSSTIVPYELISCWRTSDWSSCDTSVKTAHFRYDDFENSNLRVNLCKSYFLQNQFRNDTVSANQELFNGCLNSYYNTDWHDNCPVIVSLLNLLWLIVALLFVAFIIKIAVRPNLEALLLIVLVLFILIILKSSILQYLIYLWGF